MSRDGFLERWSRRKQETRQPPPDEPAAEVTPELAESTNEATAEEIAKLPPVESVSDLSGLRQFLRAGIPAEMRHAALRRIWRLDPKIRDHVDAAQDYAFDWNAPGGVPGGGGDVTQAQVAAILDRLFPPKKPPEAVAPAPPQAPEAETASKPPSDAAGPTAAQDTDEPGSEPVAQRRSRGRHGGATPV